MGKLVLLMPSGKRREGLCKPASAHGKVCPSCNDFTLDLIHPSSGDNHSHSGF